MKDRIERTLLANHLKMAVMAAGYAATSPFVKQMGDDLIDVCNCYLKVGGDWIVVFVRQVWTLHGWVLDCDVRFHNRLVASKTKADMLGAEAAFTTTVLHHLRELTGLKWEPLRGVA